MKEFTRKSRDIVPGDIIQLRNAVLIVKEQEKGEVACEGCVVKENSDFENDCGSLPLCAACDTNCGKSLIFELSYYIDESKQS